MSNYNPDKWIAIKITPENETPYLRIMGTWGGGYLSGDSWRLNSGVENITQDENNFYFKGYSGSVYTCGRNSYGVAGCYNYEVLEKFQRDYVDAVKVLSYDEFCDEYIFK